MPDVETLTSLIRQLASTAQSRPDLVTPGSTRTGLGGDRPFTFAGRVALRPDEDPRALLARPPTEVPDAPGSSGLGRLLPVVPAVVAPARTANERLIQSLMKSESPQLFKRAEMDPRTVRTLAKRPHVEGLDVVGRHTPKTPKGRTDVIEIDPAVLTGKKTVSATPGEISIHELLHFLNEPKVSVTPKGQALETAEQLTTLMKGTVTGQRMKHHVNRARKELGADSTTRNLEKLGVPLTEEMKAAIESSVARLALTEALSELGEESLRTADPFIKKLAESLKLR